MLKIINCNNKNFFKNLESTLNKRQLSQKKSLAIVGKIISDVKKMVIKLF